MARMEQVVQVGEIEGKIHYYIEDYAYTYLKKQKNNTEKTKFYLYGERENTEQKQNLYIYGIGLKPKMEQTYFKEYYPLGFLKIRNDEMFWISLKGQEEKIKGFFIFYAPNQAMQEYLVDNHKEEKDKPEVKVKRQLQEEPLPMKEKLVLYKKAEGWRKDKKNSGSKFVFSAGGVLAAVFIVMSLMTTSGQEKMDIFIQVPLSPATNQHI